MTRFDGAEETYAFDHAGRFFTAWRENRLYRRALDGRVMEKHTDRRGRHPVKHRRFLDAGERSALVNDAAAAARVTLRALRDGTAELLWARPEPSDRSRADRMVAAAAGFDAEAAEADRQQFEAVYTPVSILPPDRYLALVVQITEGCHWNRCTFCSFYRDRPFRVKPVADLTAHLEAIMAFFGEGLTLRRGVFLGDANALLLPAADLGPRLDLVTRCLPEHTQDVSAFIDVFTGHHKGAADFEALRARGLRRIYMGVETGDDGLLAFLNKPQTAAEAAELVRSVKAAGLAVGVIAMAGIGGRAYWRRHVEATLDVLGRMALGTGDLVYVSAFTAPANGPYAERARAEGIAPLDHDAVGDQVEELLRGAAAVVGLGTRIAPYDIEEFLY
ncbi:MAG: hypothetical protein A2Z07_02620 [Armatimonadetes bacterium RBG_16_67_12]|nr:MAG: hypothetical protein A2Z07_02620 [Armatimonadetes bacterium RBG_16_67_12]